MKIVTSAQVTIFIITSLSDDNNIVILLAASRFEATLKTTISTLDSPI